MFTSAAWLLRGDTSQDPFVRTHMLFLSGNLTVIKRPETAEGILSVRGRRRVGKCRAGKRTYHVKITVYSL